MEVGDGATQLLAREGYDPAFGARPVKRALRKFIEDPLSLKLIAGDFKGAGGIRVLSDGDSGLRFERIERATNESSGA